MPRCMSLSNSPFHSGCEAISGKKGKIAQIYVTSTFKNIVMQMKKGHCKMGHYSVIVAVFALRIKVKFTAL